MRRKGADHKWFRIFLLIVACASSGAFGTVVPFPPNRNCPSLLDRSGEKEAVPPADDEPFANLVSYQLLDRLKALQKRSAETLSEDVFNEIEEWLSRPITYWLQLETSAKYRYFRLGARPLQALAWSASPFGGVADRLPRNVKIYTIVRAIRAYRKAYPNDPQAQFNIDKFILESAKILDSPFSLSDILDVADEMENPEDVYLFLVNALMKSKDLNQAEDLFYLTTVWIYENAPQRMNILELDLIIEGLYGKIVENPMDSTIHSYFLNHLFRRTLLNPPVRDRRLRRISRPEIFLGMLSRLTETFADSQVREVLQEIRKKYANSHLAVVASRMLIRKNWPPKLCFWSWELEPDGVFAFLFLPKLDVAGLFGFEEIEVVVEGRQRQVHL
jgi:hypothetical protein